MPQKFGFSTVKGENFQALWPEGVFDNYCLDDLILSPHAIFCIIFKFHHTRSRLGGAFFNVTDHSGVIFQYFRSSIDGVRRM